MQERRPPAAHPPGGRAGLVLVQRGQGHRGAAQGRGHTHTGSQLLSGLKNGPGASAHPCHPGRPAAPLQGGRWAAEGRGWVCSGPEPLLRGLGFTCTFPAVRRERVARAAVRGPWERSPGVSLRVSAPVSPPPSCPTLPPPLHLSPQSPCLVPPPSWALWAAACVGRGQAEVGAAARVPPLRSQVAQRGCLDPCGLAMEAWRPGWGGGRPGPWAAGVGPGPPAAILMARHSGPDSCAFS